MGCPSCSFTHSGKNTYTGSYWCYHNVTTTFVSVRGGCRQSGAVPHFYRCTSVPSVTWSVCLTGTGISTLISASQITQSSKSTFYYSKHSFALQKSGLPPFLHFSAFQYSNVGSMYRELSHTSDVV